MVRKRVALKHSERRTRATLKEVSKASPKDCQEKWGPLTQLGLLFGAGPKHTIMSQKQKVGGQQGFGNGLKWCKDTLVMSKSRDAFKQLRRSESILTKHVGTGHKTRDVWKQVRHAISQPNHTSQLQEARKTWLMLPKQKPESNTETSGSGTKIKRVRNTDNIETK